MDKLLVWLAEVLYTDIIPFGIKMLGILVFWLVGLKLVKLSRKIVRNILERGNADRGVVTFLDNFVKLGLYALLIMIVLGMFGVETTSIAAAVASAGVAIGLALQGSLSNLAGGVLILLLKPFEVGHYIICSGMEGTVTEIQMFYTKLTTGDNRVCVVPNGTLSNGNIINVTKNDKRRLDITVGISYSADLRLAKDVLLKMIMDSPYILEEEANNVFVSELASSSVNLTVRVWVKTSDYWTAKASLTENIKLTLDENGVEIPYNQLDVHVVNNQS